MARWQLLALGLGTDVIGRRVRSRQFIRLYPGVYAVGHDRLTVNGRRMAAVLAAGPDAALSHRDAAALHRLRRAGGTHFEVTTSGAARTVRGLRLRTTSGWPPGHVTVVDGIPVTTVARTVADLADVLDDAGMDAALARAELAQYDMADLAAVVGRLRGRRGPGPRRLQQARGRFAAHGLVLTRSEGEELLRSVLEGHGVPAPISNHRIEGEEVDAVWPDRRAGIELDSWTHHRGQLRFVRDRAKLRRLTLAGWRILPFTAYDLMQRPALVAAEAHALLGADPDRMR